PSRLSPSLFPYTTLFRSFALPRTAATGAGLVRDREALLRFLRVAAHVEDAHRDLVRAVRIRSGVEDVRKVVEERPRHEVLPIREDRKSTRLNSSHDQISY